MWNREVEPIMRRMGFCCGKELIFNPPTLYCNGKNLCTIPRDQKYFSYRTQNVVVNYCLKCWKKLPVGPVKITDENGNEQSVQRSEFEEKVNNELEHEKLIPCHVCKRRQHQICELYHEHFQEPFVCSHCRSSGQYPPPRRPYSADRELLVQK